MKNYSTLCIGFVYFLIALGSNVFAQTQSVENSVFDPIKFQMKSVAEENAALAKKNKTLKTQLIGLQLEIEQVEEVIKDLDPEYVPKARYLREQERSRSKESAGKEELDDSSITEEVQELFISGQYMDLDEGQRLNELQLHDLQYEKQELKLDLQERQALVEEFDGQKHQELQAIEKDVQESVRMEKNMRRRIAGAEKKVLTYPQNIDLLRMENEALRKKIGQLRKLLSQ